MQRGSINSLAGFDRLCRLEDFLRGGKALSPADCAAIADGIKNFRSGQSLESALGMTGTWRHASMLRDRDQFIREIAIDYGNSFPGDTARELAKAFSDYAENCWPRERASRVAPAIYRGQLRERIFTLFQIAGGNVPTSPKQIARILKAATGHGLPMVMSTGA